MATFISCNEQIEGSNILVNGKSYKIVPYFDNLSYCVLESKETKEGFNTKVIVGDTNLIAKKIILHKQK